MPAVIDDGIYRSTVGVQLVGYISDSDPSVLLVQSINSFNTVHRSRGDVTAPAISSTTLEASHPLVHLSLCSTVL